jgi:hypothetical protein
VKEGGILVDVSFDSFDVEIVSEHKGYLAAIMVNNNNNNNNNNFKMESHSFGGVRISYVYFHI